MAIVKTDDKHYKNIANAIREKFGGGTYTPADMESGVRVACDYQREQGKQEAESKILDDCNAVAKLTLAETVDEIPRLIEDAAQWGYAEGDAVGYTVGYEAGVSSAEYDITQNCNAVIEKYTDPAELATELPDKIDEVYDAGITVGFEDGRQEMYDELVGVDVISATATGVQYVHLSDVSEISHNVSVQLSSDTITDFSNVTVTKIGKNWVDEAKFFDAANWNVGTYNPNANYHGFFYLNLKENTTYTLSFDCETSLGGVFQMYKFQKGTTPTFNNSGTSVVYLHSNGQFQKTFTFTTERGIGYGLFISGIYFDGETKIFNIQDCLTKCFKWLQIEAGSLATAHELNVEETYTANADGTVENLTSKRQYMTVYTDVHNITLTVCYNKSWGMQAAYDNFWDNIQQNGNRTNYKYMFAGEAWDDTTFKPKYNITCYWAERLFQVSKITDLKGILEARGLTIDFRNAAKNNNMSMAFSSGNLTRLPVIDLSLLPNSNGYTFYGAESLVSIDKVILKSDSLQILNETNTFQNCTSLTDIVIEGKIWRSLSFQWCPLSRASLESIMAALTDTVELAQVLTLNKAAVEAAFTTEEWETLVASKPNWTISLSA